jgi:Flp pilus assembly protein TadD
MAELAADAAPMLVIDARVREAAVKLTEGDTEGALAMLAPLLDDPAVGWHARFMTAMTAWRLGRIDWAVQLLQQCHNEAPMDGTIAEALASLYAQVGNLGEALFMGKIATALGGVGELAELVPGDFPGFDWAFLNIQDAPLLAQATLALATGRFKDGLARVRQHVALYPAARDARLYCAELLLRSGAASAAVDTLRPIDSEAELPPAFHSLYGRALAGVGEVDAARRQHGKALAGAPDDADIAAARIIDTVWTDADAETAAAADWAGRFCPTRRPVAWSRPRNKLLIGYLVSAFADPLDAAAVAAVARAHDRSRVTVVGYGRGNLTWEENAPLNGAFDKWHDISTLDAATLSRFFDRDGVHVMIDAGGFVAPQSLRALARVRTAVRVGWLGNPGDLGQPLYDVRIVPRSAVAAPDEVVWRIAGGYPILSAMPEIGAPKSGVAFGADVPLAALDAETLRTWSALLGANPTATLLLRATEPLPPANVDRLITRFGRALAARIDVVVAEQAKSFYQRVDIALAPRRGLSARAAAEAIGCGVPVIAFAGNSATEPYGPFLRDIGLGDLLVGSDERDYIGIADGLAASAEARGRVARTLALSGVADHADAGRFARDIEQFAADLLVERAPT